MTPLAQLVTALLESSEPIAQVVDDLAPLDPRPLITSLLLPTESLFEPQDLLVATAVLEAVTPRIHEISMLLDEPVGETA